MTGRMRIVFMGSPLFAVPSLNALVEAGHEVICVYTQPPRPAGRGKSAQKTAVHQRAEELGIEVRCPRTLRDAEEQARFAALEADLGVVAAYGLILPKAVLDAPRLGCINVHASLLPRWRGAAPIQRAILAGDIVTGITYMQMDEGLDTGRILGTAQISMDNMNAGELTDRLAHTGAVGLFDLLFLMQVGNARGRPQPTHKIEPTYAAKIHKSELRIDWSRSAAEIERQVRAFAPSPGAWFEANGERVKLLEAEIEPLSRHPRESGGPAELKNNRDSRFRGNDENGRGNEGLVLDDELLIQCGEGALRPILVQRAGRGVVTAEELLRGFSIPKGAVLQ